MPKAFLIKKHSRGHRHGWISPLKSDQRLQHDEGHCKITADHTEKKLLSPVTIGWRPWPSPPPSPSHDVTSPAEVTSHDLPPRRDTLASLLADSPARSLPPKKRPFPAEEPRDDVITPPPRAALRDLDRTTAAQRTAQIPGYVAIQSPFGLMHYPRVEVPSLPMAPRDDVISRPSIIQHTAGRPLIGCAALDVENLPPEGLEQTTEKLCITKKPPRFECEKCCKSYSTFSGLSKHRSFHCTAESRDHRCPDCQKVYSSLGALKMHLKTHTLPCKCAVCGKAFSRPWLLQGHLRTHTGERPFQCTHCARAFADRSNLRAHLQTHSDVKKYNCECGKSFSRNSLLVKHREGACVRRVLLTSRDDNSMAAELKVKVEVTPDYPVTDGLALGSFRTLVASC